MSESAQGDEAVAPDVAVAPDGSLAPSEPVWPEEPAEAEAEGNGHQRQICWPGQPGPARALLPRIEELAARARAAGLTEVVLLGRGIAALAADVIARNGGAQAGPLTVLDSADPAPLYRVGTDHDGMRRTVVVVTGNDPAVDALRRIFLRMFQGLGLSATEIAERFVMVGEPGGPVQRLAEAGGHAFVPGPATSAFGALSPQALVPAALAGVDVAKLLDHAAAMLPSLTRPENNPGLVLGAVLGGTARAGRDVVVVGSFPGAPAGLADWVGELVSGATGGALLPVVQHGGLPILPAPDLFMVALDGRPSQDDATVTGPLAAQLVVWEYATAVAAYLLDFDPLAPVPAPPSGGESPEPPAIATGDVEVHTTDPYLAAAHDLANLLDWLIGMVPRNGHLTIAAYLDPDQTTGEGRQVRRLAAVLAARCGRPVTVTWRSCYPAFADDQREKGVYLVLTGNVSRDVPVPERGYRLSTLQSAQAAAEIRALHERDRPVVRMHLQNRWAGLAQLLDAAQGGA